MNNPFTLLSKAGKNSINAKINTFSQKFFTILFHTQTQFSHALELKPPIPLNKRKSADQRFCLVTFANRNNKKLFADKRLVDVLWSIFWQPLCAKNAEWCAHSKRIPRGFNGVQNNKEKCANCPGINVAQSTTTTMTMTTRSKYRLSGSVFKKCNIDTIYDIDQPVVLLRVQAPNDNDNGCRSSKHHLN